MDTKPAESERSYTLKDQVVQEHAIARFGSGASSSRVKPRYDLIPISALRRLAERFGFGAEKHGDHNYKQGVFDRAFIIDRINHMIEHASKYAMDFTNGTISTTDHLGAVMCNAAILMELENLRSAAGVGKAPTSTEEGSAARIAATAAQAQAQKEEAELTEKVRQTKRDDRRSFNMLYRAVDKVSREGAAPTGPANTGNSGGPIGGGEDCARVRR